MLSSIEFILDGPGCCLIALQAAGRMHEVEICARRFSRMCNFTTTSINTFKLHIQLQRDIVNLYTKLHARPVYIASCALATVWRTFYHRRVYASQCETPSASVFRLVGGKPTLPSSLTAILADPYLSTFPDCSVRSCTYMVDLIMITAPQNQTQSIPTTPPTLQTQLRPLEAAARGPS